tara:strand:+ start:1504 stop:1869 length:366 start_codon:yes stop_codon:yes gene_type:complete
METKLEIMDNSGAKKIKCIKVLKSSRKKKGKLNHIIIGSIQSVKPNKKVNKGAVASILITRTKKNHTRRDGSFIKFSNNSGILLSEKKNSPVATRTFGPATVELKKNKKLKQVSSILNRVY